MIHVVIVVAVGRPLRQGSCHPMPYHGENPKSDEKSALLNSSQLICSQFSSSTTANFDILDQDDAQGGAEDSFGQDEGISFFERSRQELDDEAQEELREFRRRLRSQTSKV